MKKIEIKLIYVLTLAIFYLSSTQLNMIYAQTNTVCDNGGFEQDFLYYNGYISTYSYGSDSCVPIAKGDTPIVYVPTALPTTRRFEIVNSSIDSLVGIQKVKFGSKALRINSQYGHNVVCSGNFGVDKIVKQFTVTKENRNFTVWYAVVLENPTIVPHDNEQPFFNIKCDLAPADDLCFDAAILMCDGNYTDSICGNSYEPLDVLDWTCHRIRIPKSEIGKIATLEIIVADCGKGEHFGYAYIDGICEDCDSSALGSITLDTINASCSLTETSVCGHYTIPDICNQNWRLDSIIVPGYDIANLIIDTVNKTFCFDFLYSNFGPQDDCLEIYTEAYFSDGNNALPVQNSNAIDVCKVNYGYIDSLIVSQCYDNGTSSNISDDYYFVTINIRNAIGLDWNIYRKLLDPYPNESGHYILDYGTGDATLTFGPFLIQEGSWNAEITVDSTCYYELLVTPPDYCGNCSEFYEVVIDNIQCISGSPDKWSFDIMVPGTGVYYLVGSGTSGSPYDRGTANTYTITISDVSSGCEEYTIKNLPINGCISYFTVCPPKPCSVTCNIEARVESQTCSYSNGVVSYYIQLDVSDNSGKFKCYIATDKIPNILSQGALPPSQSIGPFTEEIYLTIYLCSNADCTTGCTSPNCFKSIYVPKPDITRCNQPLILGTSPVEDIQKKEVMVIPNPIQNDELILKSDLERTSFEVYSLDGQIIHRDSFAGVKYIHKLALKSGIYILRYSRSNGESSSLKFVKM